MRTSESHIAARVRAILEVPEERLDYAEAKLALDALVDPTIDIEKTAAELDRLAAIGANMAGAGADDGAKLNALRRLIYRAGPWNGHRPFEYDHANIRGADVRVKLIANYLRTRLGDCVSMPALFLILADKLGLNVALARAPQHIFVRHIALDGRVTNLEATSGGDPARDVWIREIMPMPDRAIASGYCMRTLSRRESVMTLAGTVLQHLRDSARHRESVAVAQELAELDPTNALTWAGLGQAYYGVIGQE